MAAELVGTVVQEEHKINSIIITAEPTGAAIWSKIDGQVKFLEMHSTMLQAKISARDIVSTLRAHMRNMRVVEKGQTS